MQDAPPPSENTRERLIAAAGPLFADLGYMAVSVREIAAEAGVHFSAINYHFGTKERLYEEVLAAACSSPRLKDDIRTLAEDPNTTHDPETTLRCLAESILREFDRPGKDAWMARLVMNEMLRPEPRFDVVLQHWQTGLDLVARLMAQARGGEPKPDRDYLAAAGFFHLVDSMGTYKRFLLQVVPGLEARDDYEQWCAAQATKLFLYGLSSQ